MANSKQAIKRNNQRRKRQLNNRLVIGTMRSALRKARTAVDDAAPEASELRKAAIRAIDKAVTKGVLHRSTGSRLVSRLDTRTA